jgi:hypothetical protein
MQEPRSRTGRRGFLAGIAGGVAALMAKGLVSAPEAEAANGDTVRAGFGVTATNLTKVTNTADTGAGLWGIATGATRHGIYGTNTGGGHGAGGMADGYKVAGVHGVNDISSGYGVWGESKSGSGVYGSSQDGTGVTGFTDKGYGVYAESGGNAEDVGVFGAAAIGGMAGVYGFCQTGVGVIGLSSVVGVSGTTTSSGGVGVRADAQGISGAAALQVSGPAEFSRSGLATIPRGSKSVTVTGVSLTATSLVLATAQVAAKQYVQSAVPDITGSQFVIKLNAATTADLPVAWFVVN